MLAGCLVAVFLLLSILSLRHRTLTYDEPNHYRYGRQILEGDSNRFDDAKMPISALNALPAKLAEYFPKGPLDSILSRFNTARAVTIAVGTLLGLLVFLWARQLYGRAASVLALALFALEPNVIAHSGLVTTDVYVTAFMALTMYLYWRYAQRPEFGHALLIGLAMGLSLIAKYTAIMLIPIMLLVALLRGIPSLRAAVKSRSVAQLRTPLLRGLVHTVLIGLVALAVVNAAFLFRKTFTPLASYRLRSDLLRSIRDVSPRLASIPLPVPYPYLEGLDWVYAQDRTNIGGTQRYYLLGQLSYEPFPGYFAVAYLFKSPLAAQLAFGLAALGFIRRRPWASFLDREIFLIVPLVFLTLYFNLIAHLHLGVRYFLIAFPYIMVFSASIASKWQWLTPRYRLGMIALMLYQLGSVLSYFPHYISYFNELVPDRTQAYRVLADSNIDWGQSGWYVGEFTRNHPQAIVEPSEPTSGLILVGVNELVGITVDPARNEWLRQCCEPVDTVGYSVLVFEVKPDQISRGGQPGLVP